MGEGDALRGSGGSLGLPGHQGSQKGWAIDITQNFGRRLSRSGEDGVTVRGGVENEDAGVEKVGG